MSLTKLVSAPERKRSDKPKVHYPVQVKDEQWAELKAYFEVNGDTSDVGFGRVLLQYALAAKFRNTPLLSEDELKQI